MKADLNKAAAAAPQITIGSDTMQIDSTKVTVHTAEDLFKDYDPMLAI